MKHFTSIWSNIIIMIAVVLFVIMTADQLIRSKVEDYTGVRHEYKVYVVGKYSKYYIDSDYSDKYTYNILYRKLGEEDTQHMSVVESYYNEIEVGDTLVFTE